MRVHEIRALEKLAHRKLHVCTAEPVFDGRHIHPISFRRGHDLVHRNGAIRWRNIDFTEYKLLDSACVVTRSAKKRVRCQERELHRSFDCRSELRITSPRDVEVERF